MTNSNPIQQTTRHLLKAFRTYLWLWIVPTLLFTTVASIYAVKRTRSWEASQALVLRDEAAALDRGGRFDSIDSMQAFQETLQEVARSPVVVTETLKQLGRPIEAHKLKRWPTEEEVASLTEEITVRAPQGSQFGRTEVIYLAVEGATRGVAIRRTRAVCDQLEKHLANLRSARTESVIAELEDARNLAQQDLEAASARLAEMEAEVGSDLSELRSLNQSGAGDGNLRRSLNEIKTELRQLKAANDAQLQQRELLVRAQANPDALLGTSTALLDSQPALKRLKDGLVDAQLRTSDLRGKMSPEHPLVKAAITAEQEVRRNLRAELATALQGHDADLTITRRQVDSLSRQQTDLQSRLDHLASIRASYSLLVEDVQQRTNILEERKKKLAEARASRNASQSASLITRFQEPQSSDDPIGPGNTVIVAVGLVGGLMTGVGLVFLVAPLGPDARGRRLSDYLGLGRRSTDHSKRQAPATAAVGRRSDDLPEEGRPANKVHRRRAEDQQRPADD